MTHPESCWSLLASSIGKDKKGDAIIIKWGEKGYYETDYPKGQYTDEIIDEINARGDITKAQRFAMEMCSIAAQNNPNLNWEEHYAMCLETHEKNEARKNAEKDEER